MKLTLKYTLALGVGICVILFLFGVVQVSSQSQFFRSTLQAQHRDLGRSLGVSIGEVWRLDGEARALQLIDTISKQDAEVTLRWVWIDPSASDYYRPIAPIGKLATLKSGSDVTWIQRFPDGPDRMYTYVPLTVPEPLTGALELMTSLAPLTSQVRGAIWAITGVTLGILLLSGALALLLGFWLVGRPAQQLVQQARRIGGGDFSHQLTVKQRDELGELTQEINAMCAQLADAMEARIVALNRLRHADRLATVGKLASGIAHELGTPLATVSLRASLIASSPDTTADNRENAGVIREQCTRMTQIIRQLLDFSRPRSSERQRVSLRSQLESTLKLLEPMAKRQGVLLVLDSPDNGAAQCATRVDPTQLQQVLSNLVVNALHASERGKKIHLGVEAAVAEPPADYEGNATRFYRIYVADNGEGVLPQNVPHLFDPFFTTKDVGKGTGLGLAVAYGIVREHNGWIDVETQLGEGTTFSVFLPQETT